MEQIAREATDEDRRKVEEIVRRATGSAHDCAIITFTPGMGAILFLHHNTHNRTWKLAKIREYQRRINLGDWKFNSNGAGFFTTGAISDMQHRLAAHVLCDMPWEVTVTFGVTPTRPIPWTAAILAAAMMPPKSNCPNSVMASSPRDFVRIVAFAPPLFSVAAMTGIFARRLISRQGQ